MKRLVAALVLVVFGLAFALRAFAGEVPAVQQALLFLRVLAYDRNLKTRAGDAVTVAVVHRADHADEADEMVAALNAIAGKTKVAGLSLKVVTVPYESSSNFAQKLTAVHPSAVYVCSGITDIAGIIDATRKHAALTASGREAAVKSGVSVGLVERDGHPALLINVPSSKSEGADLDAAVLRLAEVIR